MTLTMVIGLAVIMLFTSIVQVNVVELRDEMRWAEKLRDAREKLLIGELESCRKKLEGIERRIDADYDDGR